jgi:hypothetical protein
MSKSMFFALMFVAAGACLSESALADQSHYAYSVVAGGHSLTIPIPIVNSPVQVSCTQNLVGHVGLGQATLIRSSTDGGLEWLGFDYYTAAISHDFSAAAGTHIIWCDSSGEVDIEVASATSIEVVNASGGARSGVIMFVY